MIALGVAGPRAPPGFEVKIKLVGKPTFVEAVNALLNVGFAFAGNQVSFFSYSRPLTLNWLRKGVSHGDCVAYLENNANHAFTLVIYFCYG
jgi:hypothetical protein